MKRRFAIIICVFFFGALQSQNKFVEIDPIAIKNDIAILMVECNDLPISEAVKRFEAYYEKCFSKLKLESTEKLQTAFIEGAKKNGMRVTFKNPMEFGDIMFIVPFEYLEDFRA